MGDQPFQFDHAQVIELYRAKLKQLENKHLNDLAEQNKRRKKMIVSTATSAPKNRFTHTQAYAQINLRAEGFSSVPRPLLKRRSPGEKRKVPSSTEGQHSFGSLDSRKLRWSSEVPTETKKKALPRRLSFQEKLELYNHRPDLDLNGMMFRLEALRRFNSMKLHSRSGTNAFQERNSVAEYNGNKQNEYTNSGKYNSSNRSLGDRPVDVNNDKSEAIATTNSKLELVKKARDSGTISSVYSYPKVNLNLNNITNSSDLSSEEEKEEEEKKDEEIDIKDDRCEDSNEERFYDCYSISQPNAAKKEDSNLFTTQSSNSQRGNIRNEDQIVSKKEFFLTKNNSNSNPKVKSFKRSFFWGVPRWSPRSDK